METLDLRNKHKNKVIDLIGEHVKNSKSLAKNRDKILSYLLETNDVDIERLTHPIKFLQSTFPEEIFVIKDFDDLRNRLFQFMIWLSKVELVDGGYSLLISYYFYVTEQLI